ncbi:sulfotransferase family 2 domain-containing protein [Sphingomonas sp.]|uniref:sulfotransferase family 2 domain-containing protein n=1 Tax=Sphingomonas sp. TaxID=28214 RepID=UPI0025E3B806|nr:sulfotransferase family 2 domain-containing protein [Sphingomonas sp.]
MIISDQHRFAFVHIPKCAGTSVRKALRPIDETIGTFDHIAEHPQMGLIHYSHITLPDLALFFPDHFNKVQSFRSLAIVRDPVDRFFSAIFQRLREFKKFDQSQITAPIISQEAAQVIQHLQASRERLDLEYVHFNRQSDYVFNAGERIVDQVIALDRLDDAARYIETCTGIRLAPQGRENRTADLRFQSLKPIVRALRAPYVALVPHAKRERLRRGLIRVGIYGDVEKQQFVKPGSTLDTFLHDYYRQDFELVAGAAQVIAR